LARALIVGCGRRGRSLGRALLDDGWTVRGTSRREEVLGDIEAAGIEPALADPLRLGTIAELVGDVAVVAWLLGNASGPEAEAVNGERLESLMAHLVDTPVRGFVLEVPAREPERAVEIVERAERTWRIPARCLRADRADQKAWTAAAKEAVTGVIGEVAGPLV
jgi:uncharacterized protein YbjT (DUF2867 family)